MTHVSINPFHSREYIDMLYSELLHRHEFAGFEMSCDFMAGSWLFTRNDLGDAAIYASPFWAGENDISLQLTDERADCPEYGFVIIPFVPTGNVERDATMYASLVLPMLAIIAQRHAVALTPEHVQPFLETVHVLPETEAQRLVRNRESAIAKLTDDQIQAAIVECESRISECERFDAVSALAGYRTQLDALKAEQSARADRSVSAEVERLNALEAEQGVGASQVLADEFEPNEAERNIEMLDTLGIIDEVCSWAMNEDADELDDEQLVLAIERVRDVADRAKLASPEVQAHVAERLAELLRERDDRLTGNDVEDDDDDIDDDDSDDEDADETFVQELVQMFNNADDDGPFSVEVRRAETFVDADVLTSDSGLRVVFEDGRVYDITVQRGRDER